MHGTYRRILAPLLVTLTALAALAASASAGGAAQPLKVGIVYTQTGPLAAYGAQYIAGLRLGLAYATRGSNKVNGRPVELTIQDDAGDPTKAVAEAKDLIGQGYKILAGTVSSGVAVQLAPIAAQNNVLYISGPAATDAITGINRNTFRSGRQTYQDVKAASSYLGYGVGKRVVVFAQDSVFGQGNYLAVKAVMGDLGGQTVDKVLVPLTATDLTPFAQQVKDKRPDLLFIAWAGTSAATMFRTLDQQGVFDAVDKVVAGLAERSTYTLYGAPAAKLDLISHYLWNAPHNKVNNWLVAKMRARNQVPDLFTPDGFAAGQMIVHALQASPDNVGKMISSLEGWSFVGPKGQMQIRASDHALIQPMFLSKLTRESNRWVASATKTIKGQYVAPPEKK
ncbi:MAG TPA: substrate-binding domain-containing protein [Gaiellaceae bacterium]